MKRATPIAVLLALTMAGSVPAQQGAKNPKPGEKVPFAYTAEDLEKVQPEWPNPFLSFLPAEAETNWPYWHAKMRIDGKARSQRMALEDAKAFEKLLVVGETEPNDTQGTGNGILLFGTAPGEDPAADVSGTLSAPPAATVIAPLPEDEGSIPLATNTALTGGSAVFVSGIIGDGPFGSGGTGSGDFDFYRVPGVTAGQVILVDVNTPVPFGPLDPYVVLHDSAGAIVATNDDGDASSWDSFLLYTAQAPGDYYVSIGGWISPTVLPALTNPFVSSSGPGAGSEGSYDVTIGLSYLDVDYFTVQLRKGDILGATVSGAGSLVGLFDGTGVLRIESGQDASFIYPAVSPLPGGANGVAAYVIEKAGKYSVRVAGPGTGAYTLQLRAFRNPLLSGSPGDQQILFVDFDGATINPAIFGGPSGSAFLSPLSSFLAGWGLTPADESNVIDAILKTIEENISTDVRNLGNNFDFDATGIPSQFDIEILNSRDHTDPFGSPNVSRLIIGGTIGQLGISTIGIAQSIDPGNFEIEETGVILLDLLSAPASNPNSLNSFPLGAGVSKIEIVGVGVGNIAAHEAGHYIGNFHTEQFTTKPNIMDQGGNLANTVGVGPDGIFGTADDVDVDFGVDIFVPNEGFVGIEDTLNVISFGCPTPESATVVIDGCDSGTTNYFLRDDSQISDHIGACAAGATTHLGFTTCVRSFLGKLVNGGVLTIPEARAIFTCADGAGIP